MVKPSNPFVTEKKEEVVKEKVIPELSEEEEQVELSQSEQKAFDDLKQAKPGQPQIVVIKPIPRPGVASKKDVDEFLKGK